MNPIDSSTPDRLDAEAHDGPVAAGRPSDAGHHGDLVGQDVPPARRWAAGHVIVAVLVALLVGSLLNARDLQATAERQEFGWQRDVAVALVKPLVAVSNALGLDEPRNAIDSALGRGPEPEVVVDPEPTPEPSPSSPSPAPSSPSEAASQEPTPEPSRSPISASDPLRVYIGGDSMVEIQFGTALEDLLDDTGVIEVQAIDFDRGSGLSRPDFVDWPARLAGVSQELEPEVMVLWFGGNDAQPLKIDGVVRQVLEPEWEAEYRSRVAALMDQLVEAGHAVYWLGMPIPRDVELQEKWKVLDAVYESEAGVHKGVKYVRMWETFAGPDGQFSEYLPNRNGDVVDMRLNDGIHLTTAGAYKAARVLMPILMMDFAIPEPEDE